MEGLRRIILDLFYTIRVLGMGAVQVEPSSGYTVFLVILANFLFNYQNN